MTVQPVFGSKMTFPADLDHGPVLLGFVRSLSTSSGRAQIAALQCGFADLDRQGVRVVAVTRSPLRHGRDFVPRHHLLFPLVCDEDGSLRRTFGVGEDRWWRRSIACLPTGGIGAAMAVLDHGHGLPDGGLWDLPAWFVLGEDGCVAFADYPDVIYAQPDVGRALRVATGQPA